MTLILFEGLDNSGKSTVIKQLVEKYPNQFTSFAFPTSYWLDQKLNIEKDGLWRYHMEFEADFMLHEPEIDKLQRKKTILLDRYFISNLAYSRINLKKYRSTYFIESLLERIKHLVPDLVVFIRQYNPKDFEQEGTYSLEELNELQKIYLDTLRDLWGTHKIHDFKSILIESKEDRNKNLFGKVEQVLKDRGYLD